MHEKQREETYIRLLTPLEAAAILRVKETTIRIWLRAGRLRGKRIGGSWRIPVSEIERVVS